MNQIDFNGDISIIQLLDIPDCNNVQSYYEVHYGWQRIILRNLHYTDSKLEVRENEIVVDGLHLTMKIVRKFGRKFSMMTIDFSEVPEHHCHYLEQQIVECCASTLLHLKLIHSVENSRITTSVFESLQTLEFQWCSISRQMNFNFFSPALYRLIFTNWNDIDEACMNIRFTNLNELRTTMFLAPNLIHFNIPLRSIVRIKDLNPNISISLRSLSNLDE